MFFILAKVLAALTMPGNLLVLLLTLGVVLLVFGALRTGLSLLSLLALAAIAIMLLPIGQWMSAPLENRFPQPELPQRIDGIILLGGALSLSLTVAHGQVALNDMASRVTETLALAQRHPGASVLISGGEGELVPQKKITEAAATRSLLVAAGLDARRVLVEDRARDTYENAVYSKIVANPQPGQNWILVTSANHMPRAVGCFRKVGFEVIPYPVDYKSGTHSWLIQDFAGDLHIMDYAAHEWIGLVTYRLAGRIDSLLPGPGPAPSSAISAR